MLPHQNGKVIMITQTFAIKNAGIVINHCNENVSSTFFQLLLPQSLPDLVQTEQVLLQICEHPHQAHRDGARPRGLDAAVQSGWRWRSLWPQLRDHPEQMGQHAAVRSSASPRKGFTKLVLLLKLLCGFLQ